MARAPDSSRSGLVTAAQDLRQKVETFQGNYSRDDRFAVLLGHLSLILGELDVLQNALDQSAAVDSLTSLNGPSYEPLIDALHRSTNEFLRHLAQPGDADGLSRASSHAQDVCESVWRCSVLVKDLNFSALIHAAFHAEHRHDSARSHELVELQLENLYHPKLEIVACYGELVRYAEVYDQHAPRPGLVQPVDIEVEIRRLIGNMIWIVGLETHPLGTQNITDLKTNGLLEYQHAVENITNYGSHDDLRCAPRQSRRQCNVTVHLAKRALQMKGYILFPWRCCWLDDQGRVALEQAFEKPPSKRYPWRHDLHAKLTVSYTVQDAKYCNIVSYRAPMGPYKHNECESMFVFQEQKWYEQFQSDLREQHFVGEFEALRVEASGASYTPDPFVKIWQEEFPLPGRTITLPITHRDQIHHEEIKLQWMLYDTTHSISSNTFKVELKFRKPAAKAVNGNGTARRLSRAMTLISRRGSSSSTVEISPEEVAPQELRALGNISITFKSRKGRDDFVECFTPTAVQSLHSPLHNGTVGIDNRSASPGTPFRSPLSMVTPTSGVRSHVASTPADSARSPQTQDTSILPSPESALPSRNVQVEETGAIQFLEPYDLPGPYVDDDVEDLWRRGGPQASPTKSDALRRPISGCYHPLEDSNDMRLLRIKGGSGSKIVCCLEHHNLSEGPEYEALSYCWGQSPSLKSITIDDNDKAQVSEHLWHALQRLRFADRDRCVWIDAICIDQDDVIEKNMQLRLMPTIYQKAYRTIIWIGNLNLEGPNCEKGDPADGDDSEARTTLCTTQDRLRDHEHNLSRELGTAIKKLRRQMRASGHAYVWWQRLWCVQEFFFSARQPTVYIGPHAIGWKHFAQLFESKEPLSVFHRLLAEKGNERDTASGDAHSQRPPRTLFDLLFLTASFGCRDHRDRVFSLLGMAPRASERIRPDYHNSVLRVLEDSCLYLIRESQSLDVLLDGRVNRQFWCGVEKKIPTWIPELTSLQGFELVKGRDNYCAGPGDPQVDLIEGSGKDRDTDSTVPDFDMPRALSLKAVYFDTIVARTRERDIPDHEESPDGHLIYNSSLKRGHLLDAVLNVLEYKFEVPKGARRPRDPCLGCLILHYLFEDRRSIVDEIERRDKGPTRNPLETYKRQRKKDLEYVQNEGAAADENWVKDRWYRKIETTEQEYIFYPQRLASALKHDNIWEDFMLAREFENVFAYARKTRRPYYFTNNDFDAPMHKDVLEAESIEDVRKLRGQYDEVDPEFHHYSAKYRKRDFFKTRNGFLGMGPDSLEVGDDIVMAFGAGRPLILRSIADGPGQPKRHQLVGDAFVPNFMAGQWTRLVAGSAGEYCIE